MEQIHGCSGGEQSWGRSGGRLFDKERMTLPKTLVDAKEVRTKKGLVPDSPTEG
jgi:hypothetical protein